MAIEFHCEHCNRLIRAPKSEAGQPGKCPYCKGRNYIPLPSDETGELSLAPLDEDYERHRRRAAAEDAATQRKLLQERDTSRTKRGRPPLHRPAVSGSASPAPTTLSHKQLTTSIVEFIEAMSSGTLDKAEKISTRLAPHRAAVNQILDDMLTQDLAGYGLPTLPRPVLLGFLKQLRARN